MADKKVSSSGKRTTKLQESSSGVAASRERQVPRMALFLLAALLVSAGVVFGGRWVYQQTQNEPASKSQPAANDGTTGPAGPGSKQPSSETKKGSSGSGTQTPSTPSTPSSNQLPSTGG